MPDHCVTDTRVCSCVGECSGDPQSAECRHLPTHATDTRVCKWPSCTLGDGQVCADCPGLPHATGSRAATPLCLAKSDGLGARCSRYDGHDGPHMTFDRDGAWSAQWPAGWNDPLDGWEEWTWQKEQG